MPSLLKKYSLSKVAQNGGVMLICVLVVIIVALIAGNSRNPARFSTYADLEYLHTNGTKYVTAELSSAPTLDLNPYTSHNSIIIRGGREFAMISLSEDNVIVDQRRRPYYNTSDKDAVFRISKTPYEIEIKIEKRIESLESALKRDYSTPVYTSSMLESMFPDQPMLHLDDESLEKIAQEQRAREESIRSTIERELEKLANASPIVLTMVDLEYANLISGIFYFICSIVFIIFAFKLFIAGAILVSPRISATYRSLAEYGDPETLISQFGKSISSQKKSYMNGDIIYNKEFAALFLPTSVYIAPTKDLLWAYIAFQVRNQHRHLSTFYSLVFCFSSGKQKSVRIKNKDEGIRILHGIKKTCPDVIVGFSQSLREMWGDLKSFKFQFSKNAEEMRNSVSPHEQANIVSYLHGLDKTYK